MADLEGTCHLVGCDGKGVHPPHGIGTPDTFAPYDEPVARPASVVVARSLLVRADSLLSALVRGRVAPRHSMSPADIEEAEILQQAFRKASERSCG